MTDLADLEQWAQIEQALHGNLQPLLDLLRSDQPLTKQTREYIAEQIERAPDKRFRRQRNVSLEVREADRLLLFRVHNTKMEIALRRLGPDADGCVVYSEFDSISDREALDFLSENYGVEVSEDELNNALRRAPGGIFDPRGPRRMLRKLNL